LPPAFARLRFPPPRKLLAPIPAPSPSLAKAASSSVDVM